MFERRADPLVAGAVLDVAGHPVRLRVDGRARRVSLRLDAASREVIATAPSPRRLKDAVAFANQRAAWISEAVGRLPVAQSLSPGGTIEILGRPCLLVQAPGRRSPGLVGGDDLRLVAAGEGPAFARAAVRLLRAEALRVFRARTAVHAAALGQSLPQVGVMDARSRWGSCTPPRKGRIGGVRYSWRLILAPYHVMDYVAAHECAHLVHADHSPRFWAVVQSLVADVKGPRAWLRAHGPRLHGVGR